MTPAIGFYRARVAFSFAHSTLLAGYGRIIGNSSLIQFRSLPPNHNCCSAV